MLASAALLMLAAPAAATSVAADPISLFKSACFTGEIHLDPAQLHAVDFKHLPHAAKVAVARSIYRGPGVSPYPIVPPQADMPNPLYRIAGDQTYLVEPTPDEMRGSRFADSCIVVWRGDGFEQARSLIQPGPPSPGTVTAHRAGIGYVSTHDGQRVLAAALVDNWTVLRWAPASTEPDLTNFMPGAQKH